MADAVDVMREVLRVRENHNEYCACSLCNEGMTRLITKLEMNELPPAIPGAIPPGRQAELEEMLRRVVIKDLGIDKPREKVVGDKHDQGKDPFHLLPWKALGDVVKVLAYGAKRYSPNNWVHVEPFRERYFAAAMRHITAWWNGETTDPDSGLPHLAHGICSLLFLLAKERGDVGSSK